jgi:O-antigen/teichoic acid export membrane protein
MADVSTPANRPPVEHHHLSSWRTLLRSFAQLSTGEVLARLIGFAALVALTRRLGPASFGLVTLGVTLVLWLKLVVDAGTETLNVRDIARRPDRFKEIAGPVLGLRLCLSGFAVVLFIAIPFLFVDDSRSRRILWLFALALPAIALNLRLMVLGLRAAKGVAIGNIASQLLFAAGVLFLVHGSHETFLVPLLLAASELLYGLVILALVAPRFGLPLPLIDVAAWRTTLSGGLPLMANQLSRGVMQSFDLIFITIVLGKHWTGIYGAASKPLLFVTTVMALLVGSFLASYSAASADQGQELIYKMTRLALATSVPIAILVSAGSSVFMSTAFGNDYRPGSTALAILAWFIPAAVLGNIYGTVLIANDRQALLMRHYIATALFNIGGNVVAVPLAGIDGAAVVTLISSVLLMFLNYRGCVRLGLTPSAGQLAKRLVAGFSTPTAAVRLDGSTAAIPRTRDVADD